MILNLLFFGLGGSALVLVGLWGQRRIGRLSTVPGGDEEITQHRRKVVRRGCLTCIALGAVFLAVAIAAPFLSPGR